MGGTLRHKRPPKSPPKKFRPALARGASGPLETLLNPLKCHWRQEVKSKGSWYAKDITGAMWDSWGRGDLDLLESMGVNTLLASKTALQPLRDHLRTLSPSAAHVVRLRMYGNDLRFGCELEGAVV